MADNVFTQKRNIPYIIYFSVLFGLFLIAALTLVLIFVPRALNSNRENSVTVHNAALVSADSDEEPVIPSEYILRQQFDTHGLAILVDGKKIMLDRNDVYRKYVLDVAEENGIQADPDSDDFKAILEGEQYQNALSELEKVTVNADLAAAGEKQIEVVYKVNDYTYYSAVLPATVYFVRAVEVTSYPEVVSVSDGNATLDSEFAIYATLGKQPMTDDFGEVEKDGEKGWRIKLNESMYTQSLTEDTKLKSFYTLTFYCGNLSTEFSFYNAAGRSFIVGTTRDVVKYEKSEQSSGDEELTLVVTDRDKSYQKGGVGGTKGDYIYKNGEGVETVFPFEYELTETDELLKSDNIEESHDDEGYYANVDGVEFAADETLWQSAVVNGSIVDDHGFKVVIGSVRRILNFEYAIDEMSTTFPVEEMPESFALNGSVENKIASIACADDNTWTLVYGTEEESAAIASGTWEYTENKSVVLTVTDDTPDASVVDKDGNDVKDITIGISTANGTFTYTAKLSIADREDETVYEFNLEGSNGTLPSLTLYVTEYDMNPLLGTGNGYSVGKYVYTDSSARSTLIDFYMQAWVWTFVPLSSSHGDPLSDTTVSDVVWDGVPDAGHYNSYFRGTMYSNVTHYNRGVGFVVDSFYAPESLWLNALMNM